MAQDTAGNRTTSAPVTVTVSNGPAADTIPPTVTITSPTAGATVSGTIPVNADATDNVGVVAVEFRLDGADPSVVDTTAPYSISWDTTGTTNGSHTLSAIAHDAAGNRTISAPVTVTVSNAGSPPSDTTPPTVTITSPTEGATVTGPITVSATASDNVGVAGVEFKLDGADPGVVDTTAPYSISWDTTGTSNGSHTLTAMAQDAAGNRTTSAPVTVTVSNAGSPPGDTTPPTVTITSPTAGATVTGTVTVSATASDNVGLAGVEFNLDGGPGVADFSAPYSIFWDTTGTTNGSHTLTAVAQDAAGNRTTSAPVTVRVANDPVLRIISVSLDRPTLHMLGVQMLISGDDNRNAGVGVRYRPAGSSVWREGLPLLRVFPETVKQPVPQQFAGSIFDLTPDTSYEIELHAVDPDGPVDEIRILTGRTRPVPRENPATPRNITVTSAAEFQSALASAVPGDVIVLANGMYSGRFVLSASGTADNPIVIQGESMSGVILDGENCSDCNVLEVSGSDVHVERLTIQNAERALRFFGTTQNNVARRIHITNVIHGIAQGVDQRDFYICDNIIEGRLSWPWVFQPDADLHLNDRGVAVHGDGHVVCHNRISGFGDALMNTKVLARSLDFYGNDILDSFDGTELDVGGGNLRVFQNRWTNVVSGISLQPVYGGPAYVLRNVLRNVVGEQIKFKSLGGTDEPSGAFIYHNTFVSPKIALNLQTPIIGHNFLVMNNLFVGPRVLPGRAVEWTEGVDRGTFDFNGYFPDGGFWLGTINGVAQIFANFAALQASGVFEMGGTLLTEPIFAGGFVGPTDGSVRQDPADFTLASASNAIDRGTRLPGINQSFVGAAPDLGALESGCPTPTYGPRPEGSEHLTPAIDCNAPDTLPPTVTITSPASGATVSGVVTISATATDNVGVAGVEFHLDGGPGVAVTTAPYSISWDTTGTSNGSHTLTAMAQDTAGNRTTSAPVTVTVFNGPPPDTTPPTVAITSPAAGATVSGVITISASATDDVGVAGVEFHLDGGPAVADTTAPYSISWETTGTSNGSHTLTAMAQDTAGNRTTSAPVTVTVFNDTTLPTVIITSPAAGATVSGVVTISASATDDVGVAGVEFQLDGGPPVPDTTAPYSISWDTTGTSNGSHTLTAMAQDTAGNRTTSAPVTVTVFNGPPPDTTPPTVAITSPASGATVAGPVTISADASDNVGVVGVEFSLDGGPGVADTTAPYSISWDTTGTSNGSHTLTAIAQDAAGNRTTSAPVTITVNNAPLPTVTRVEETDPSITYSAGWLQGDTSREWSGGTAALAAAAGARATLTFTGTSVSWIGFRGPMTGIAHVFLDGVFREEVDTFSSTEEVRAVLFTATELAAGSHTVTIEVTGLQNAAATSAVIVVDAFDVSSSSPAPTITRFQETDPSMTYTAGWTRGDTSRAWSGGTATVAAAADAHATFTFTGTSVTWIGFRGPMTGIARVTLDGVLTEVDTFSSTEEVQAALFTATDLPDATHTLTIEVTGLNNAASTNTFIVTDAFDVTSSFPARPGTRFQETDPSATYTAGWVQGDTSRAWSAGAAALATTAGEGATFTFTGTSVSWIGFRGPMTGIARVALDGVATEVDTFSSTEEVQAVLFTATDLAVGSHTLTIEVTGLKNAASANTFIVVDAFDVYD
jgi:hypothetical protein